MADVIINGSPFAGTNQDGQAQWGPFWLSPTEGAVIFEDGNDDLVAIKTTTGVAGYGSVIVGHAETVRGLACWFERSNPGNSGTKVHCVFLAAVAADLLYAAFDISAGTWSSPVTLNASVDVSSIHLPFIAGTRSGGFVAGSVVATGTASYAYKSANGSSWSAIANPYESNAADMVRGVSVNTGDNNDAGVVFQDASADAISVKMYDDSANTWTETAIGALTEINNASQWEFSTDTRLSDGHTILAVINANVLSTSDIDVYDLTLDSIASPTVTTKTDAIVDTGAQTLLYAVAVIVDQITNDIYVCYLAGPTQNSDMNAWYVKSTDGGTSWGSETAVSVDVSDDHRVISAGAMGTAGGLIAPVWFDDDDNDLISNADTSVTINPLGQPTWKRWGGVQGSASRGPNRMRVGAY